MTKTTEELKREMFKALVEMKGRIEINYSIKDMLRGVDEFEHALEDCLQSMREDRDTLRNKLQAFEFANRSAAELLSEALREPSGLRKTESCALALRSQENASFGIPDALLRCPAHFIQTNCKEGRHFMVNSRGPDGGLHCLACGHHREIPQ